MSDQEDYLARLSAISAIAPEDVKRCPIPLENYLQEAENLYQWATDDFPQLRQAGLHPSTLDELAIRTGALREAEGLMRARQNRATGGRLRWAKQAPQAYTLRDELLRALRYALRDQPQAQASLAAISAGTGHADMIQDLASLGALARKHPEALTAIGYDLDKLHQVAATAEQISATLAAATGERLSGSPERIRRDQAYTYLKAIVDDVRECGKYVFPDKHSRRRGYVSAYKRKANNNFRKNAKAVAPKK